MFKECLDMQSLPPSFSQAHIVFIPKPGKDLTLCPSYRPISLLNYDIKILAMVFATRLVTILPTLVSIEQTGFIKASQQTLIYAE